MDNYHFPLNLFYNSFIKDMTAFGTICFVRKGLISRYQYCKVQEAWRTL